MKSYKRLLVFVLFFASTTVFAAPSRASVDTPPGVYFEETIFEVKDGEIIAPRAMHLPFEPPKEFGRLKAGWTPLKDGDYIAYDTDGILDTEQGTFEVDLVLLGDEGKPLITHSYVQALITLYDGRDKAFFTVGINNTDLVIGSFPIHPMLMEDAFGGASFPYLSKLDGPLREGTEVKVTVTWGPAPSDGRVYVNGRYLDLDSRRGPRGRGAPPGYQPTVPFSSFLKGFEGFTGGPVGPPKTLTIGRIGTDRKINRTGSPMSVAIKSVRLSGRTEVP